MKWKTIRIKPSIPLLQKSDFLGATIILRKVPSVCIRTLDGEHLNVRHPVEKDIVQKKR